MPILHLIRAIKGSFSAFFIHIVSKPIPMLAAVAVVTMVFALALPRLAFRTSVFDMVIEDMPDTRDYEQFKQRFGSDEIIRIVVKTENVLAPETFARITRLAEQTAAIKGVARVIGLPGVKQAVDPAGNWPMERFAKVIGPVRLFERNLISKDRRTTALTLVLEENADHESVIGAIDRSIGQAPETLSLYQIGMPLVSKALVDLTARDFFRLPPVTIAVIAVVLIALFRSVQGLILPLSCVLVALVWTFGMMAMAGVAMSMLTMMVPVFLIAVGTAYCMYVVSAYVNAATEHGDRFTAIVSTYQGLWLPTVLAVGTTVTGLGSLALSQIPTIREFAFFAAFGILSLLALVLTMLPSLMALMPLPRPIPSYPLVQRFIEKLIQKAIHLTLHRQRQTLTVMLVITAAGIMGIFMLHVDTNPLGYFKADNPIARRFHDAYADLSGAFPINISVSGPQRDFFEEPKNLEHIEKLQAFVETLPGIDKAFSFVDYLKLVNYSLNNFDPKAYRLPEASWELRMVINNYKGLLGEDMFSRFMSADMAHANIVLLTRLSSAMQFLKTRQLILDFTATTFPPELQLQTTGFGMVISASSHLLVSGQLKSLLLTLVLIFAVMLVLFLSRAVGLIAIAANLFPIVFVYGLMGWVGIELSMVTTIIASVAIGLAVDDTIHFLTRFNAEFRQHLDKNRALQSALMHIGKAMVFTSLTISLGFCILMFSGFKATAIFGLLMVVTMGSALAGDMILLPALILNVELVTVWDLLRLKMGKDPQSGIPVFRDLSRTQIHAICMAGGIKTIRAGKVLFYQGDPSDSMFAVISGRLDVIDHPPGADPRKAGDFGKRLAVMAAGDVMGEMGLLRHAPRSATIIAREDAELLEINLRMIQRLQWLYPPTAHRFFFNLMTILCDRLEAVSHCLANESTVDDGTGFCNEKHFTRLLTSEIDRCQRYQNDLSLCLLKMEGTGNGPDPQVMHDVATALSPQLRRTDIVGRVDPKTFALLLPETPLTGAQRLWARIKDRLSLKENPRYREGIRFSVAFSSAENGLLDGNPGLTGPIPAFMKKEPPSA